MSEYINKVNLCGTIERMPEIRTANTGSEVMSFTVKTIYSYYQKDEKKEIPQFTNVAAWRPSDELKDLMRAGCRVLVEGRLVSRSYQNKAGAKVWVTEVNASKVSVVDDNAEIPEPVELPVIEIDKNEELPF